MSSSIKYLKRIINIKDDKKIGNIIIPEDGLQLDPERVLSCSLRKTLNAWMGGLGLASHHASADGERSLHERRFHSSGNPWPNSRVRRDK